MLDGSFPPKLMLSITSHQPDQDTFISTAGHREILRHLIRFTWELCLVQRFLYSVKDRGWQAATLAHISHNVIFIYIHAFAFHVLSKATESAFKTFCTFYQFMHSLEIKPMTLVLPALRLLYCLRCMNAVLLLLMKTIGNHFW